MNTRHYSIALAALLAVGMGATFGLTTQAQASPALTAQRQGRMRGGMGMGMMGDYVANPTMLLRRKDVSTDIKLTSDQQAKLDQIRKDARGSFRGGQQGDSRPSQADMEKSMKEYNDKVNAVLTPEQQKRLKEIAIQLMGNKAITDKSIQTDLKLTDGQKAKVKSLQEGYDKAMQDMGEKMRSGDMDFTQFNTTKEANDKALDAELGKVLTTDQTAQLKTMGGAKFTATDKPFSFGGGRRGGGRPGGGGPGGGGPGGGGPGGGGPGGGGGPSQGA